MSGNARGVPTRVAVLGAGDCGRTLVCQLGQIPGMRASVVCDLEPDRGVAAFGEAGTERDDVRLLERPSQIADAVEADRPSSQRT